MTRERRHFHRHMWKQRQTREDSVQFVIRLDVEDAVVRIFTDDSMQLLPLSLSLKLLGICLLTGLDFVGLRRGHIVGQVDFHSYEIEHMFLI